MTKTVIFDLDGTLALIDHRRHLLDDKTKTSELRWRAFFAACVDDKPNTPVIAALHGFEILGFRIVIFSGRSDEVREQTIQWLDRYDVCYEELIMRKAGDFTPDHELKKKWLEEMNRDEIFCVFDDRKSVVDMWREHGLTCFQVAPGDF